MRRVVVTVEDTLPNGKYIAESKTITDAGFIWEGDPVAVAESLIRKLDNRLWIEGKGLEIIHGPTILQQIGP